MFWQRSVQVSVVLVDLDGDLSRFPRNTDKETNEAVRIAHRGKSRRYADSLRVLRASAATYLGRAPETLELSHLSSGKPFLSTTSARALPLELSISRSGRWCAVGLATDSSIGVDVEIINRYPFAEDVASTLFPTDVHVVLAGMDGAEHDRMFSTWWARVEAAVKACGSNLDDAKTALDRAPQVARELKDPGLAIAVAAAGSMPHVHWDLPPYVI